MYYKKTNLGDLPLEGVLEGLGERLEDLLVVLFSLLHVRRVLISEAEALLRDRLQPKGPAAKGQTADTRPRNPQMGEGGDV